MNTKIKEFKTKLKMRPVCECCGHIFHDGVIVYKDILETNGVKYPKYSIIPNECPNCKNEIECIEYCNYEVDRTKYEF